MMAELVTRGPIACTIAVTEQFEQYSSGVFNDTTGAKVIIIGTYKSAAFHSDYSIRMFGIYL